MSTSKITNKYTLILIMICLFTSTNMFSTSPPELTHVAVIADGNRRWAEDNNLSLSEGHREGFVNNTPKIIEELWDMGIHTVTIWGFSTENWKRGDVEVKNLMEYYDELFMKMLPIAKKYNAKIVHVGRKDRLPAHLLQTINLVENETSIFNDHLFNFALDFGGRDEIIRAFQKIQRVKGSLENITEDDVTKAMDTGEQPYPSPDLIIRTSGEVRLSGFMAWQSAYSEFYFMNKHYPAVTRNDLEKAAESYKGRKRRFGR